MVSPLHRLPRLLLLAALVAPSTPVLTPLAARADGLSEQRAANLARNVAVRLNGGLSKYHPAGCMFSLGGGPCLIRSDAKGYTFRFDGGSPGWQQLNLPPTVRTEITIDPTGRQVVGKPKTTLLGPAKSTGSGPTPAAPPATRPADGRSEPLPVRPPSPSARP
jgi:hypothetical protein